MQTQKYAQVQNTLRIILSERQPFAEIKRNADEFSLVGHRMRNADVELIVFHGAKS